MLCEKFGWTWQELQEAPQFFIAQIYAKLTVEAKHQKDEEKKLQRKMKTTRAKRH